MGGDGATIESVLYFDQDKRGWVAFSAQKGLRDAGSAPSHSGGGIRLTENASQELWTEGRVGEKVVVVK